MMTIDIGCRSQAKKSCADLWEDDGKNVCKGCMLAHTGLVGCSFTSKIRLHIGLRSASGSSLEPKSKSDSSWVFSWCPKYHWTKTNKNTKPPTDMQIRVRGGKGLGVGGEIDALA